MDYFTLINVKNEKQKCKFGLFVETLDFTSKNKKYILFIYLKSLNTVVTALVKFAIKKKHLAK